MLQHELRGKSIADVLELPVEEAAAFFTEKAVRPMLERLMDVGLGYMRLGQTLTTLSGGERQRLKLAIEMGTDAATIVLDEPTTGLHMADVVGLIGLLDRIVDAGRTVIVIEHNLDVVARADWVIDLGPGRARRAAGSCSRARPRRWRRSPAHPSRAGTWPAASGRSQQAQWYAVRYVAMAYH